MKIEKEKTEQRDDEFEQNKSESDNQKGNINQNNFNNEIKDSSQKNDLIDDDINIEMNNIQENIQSEQNPEDIKKEEIEDEFERSFQRFRKYGIKSLNYKRTLTSLFAILSVHLLIILFFIILFRSDSIKSYFDNKPIFSFILLLISLLVLLFTVIALDIVKDLRIKTPHKYIVLLILTLSMSFTWSLFDIRGSFSIAYFCAMLILFTSIALLISVKLSRVITSEYLGFFSVILAQFAGVILMVFILDITISIIEIIFCLFLTLIFGIYLDFKSQMIEKVFSTVYSKYDSIFVFLEIYVDILVIFKIIYDIFLRLFKKLISIIF